MSSDEFSSRTKGVEVYGYLSEVCPCISYIDVFLAEILKFFKLWGISRRCRSAFKLSVETINVWSWWLLEKRGLANYSTGITLPDS